MRMTRWSFTAVVVAGLAVLIGYWISRGVQLRERYLSLNLEPRGSGLVAKDLAGYVLASIPRVQRVLTTGSSRSDTVGRRHALEGFHTSRQSQMEFFSWLTPKKQALVDSKFFAENYYFWVGTRDGSFLVTTRLSFYGVNASTVIPWFTFQLEGEEWNLPEDFSPHPYRTGDPRVARDPKYGVLLFENPDPMKRWVLTYKGKVQSSRTKELREVDCEFDLKFSPHDVFVYQTNWDEMATALSLASKPWTRQMFQNLREQNQERYASKASGGSGFVKFVREDKLHQFPDLIGSRDHLWGIRDWLFMYRYIWWPPITLSSPLVIEGISYTSFLGAFVEYGDTLGNMVVGGFMSESGDCASFSSATGMRDIAPEWYDVISKRNEFIGEKYLPRTFQFRIAILNSRYVVEIELERGKPAGLWSHSFALADGDFEIHEALTKFKFKVRSAAGGPVISSSSAVGLFEFGGNLLGKVSSS